MVPGHQDNPSALVLGWTAAWLLPARSLGNCSSSTPTSKSSHLFTTAQSKKCHHWRKLDQSESFHGIFINRIRDRKPLCGEGKITNSEIQEALVLCSWRKPDSYEQEQNQNRQKSPKSTQALAPIIHNAQPSPALLVCLPIHPSTVISKTLLIFQNLACFHPHFHGLQPKKKKKERKKIQTLTLMLITSKHCICFKQVLYPLNFFCPKGLPVDI